MEVKNKYSTIKYKAIIKALTPLHFGSGDFYYKGLDIIGNNLIDINKLFKIKEVQSNIVELNNAIENRNLGNIATKYINDIKIKEIEYKGNINSSISEVRKHITNGFGNYYVPGSSIKGSIRTAVINYLIQNSDSIKQNISNEIKNIFESELKSKKYFEENNKKFKPKVEDKNILKEILGSNPFKDIMKTVCITDSNEIKLDKMYVYAYNINKSNKSDLLIEVLPENTEFSFEINILNSFLSYDNEIKEKYNKNYFLYTFDHSKLLDIIHLSSLNILSYHLEQYRNEDNLKSIYENILKTKLNNNQALINLGYASGWVGMTGNIIGDYYNTLNENDKKLFREIFNLAPDRLSFDFPKSRRVIKNNNQINMIPGWGIITIEGLNININRNINSNIKIIKGISTNNHQNKFNNNRNNYSNNTNKKKSKY